MKVPFLVSDCNFKRVEHSLHIYIFLETVVRIFHGLEGGRHVKKVENPGLMRLEFSLNIFN